MLLKVNRMFGVLNFTDNYCKYDIKVCWVNRCVAHQLELAAKTSDQKQNSNHRHFTSKGMCNWEVSSRDRLNYPLVSHALSVTSFYLLINIKLYKV